MSESWGLLKYLLAIVLVTLFIVDVSGTPVALIALSQTNQHFVQFKADVKHARYDDCISAETLRGRARARIIKEETDLPSTLALLHITPTVSVLKKAQKGFEESRAQVAAVDCVAYSNELHPKGPK